MSRQESDRLGRPETCVLKISLATEETVRRMFASGLALKKRKGTSSKPDEPVRASDWGHAGTAGTDDRGLR